MKKVLTIAGSDSCGGAGIQADLKTFSANGTFGMSVITAITAQNTQGVWAVEDLSPQIIEAQIDAIFKDIEVDGVKIGMVSKIETIDAISKKLNEYKPKNVVLDPVMISKSGFDLLKPESKKALIENLIPLSSIITPNIPEALDIIETYKEMYKDNDEYSELLKEAETLTTIETREQMETAAKIIHFIGAPNVLLKGGHLADDAVDILYDGKEFHYFEGERIHTKNTHGTGCTLSSAICANLALGYSLTESIKRAKEYITEAIKHSLDIGHGVGPTNHFYTLYKKAGML